jgi:hypothetical protein
MQNKLCESIKIHLCVKRKTNCTLFIWYKQFHVKHDIIFEFYVIWVLNFTWLREDNPPPCNPPIIARLYFVLYCHFYMDTIYAPLLVDLFLFTYQNSQHRHTSS